MNDIIKTNDENVINFKSPQATGKAFFQFDDDPPVELGVMYDNNTLSIHCEHPTTPEQTPPALTFHSDEGKKFTIYTRMIDAEGKLV